MGGTASGAASLRSRLLWPLTGQHTKRSPPARWAARSCSTCRATCASSAGCTACCGRSTSSSRTGAAAPPAVSTSELRAPAATCLEPAARLPLTGGGPPWRRLDMSKRLANCRGRDLYAFWRERITQSLARCAEQPARGRLFRRRRGAPSASGSPCRELEGQPEESRFVVDCASLEYSRAVDRGALGAPVYTLAFPGPAVYAKQARGSVVRFAAETCARSPADFRRFTGGRRRRPPVRAEARMLLGGGQHGAAGGRARRRVGICGGALLRAHIRVLAHSGPGGHGRHSRQGRHCRRRPCRRERRRAGTRQGRSQAPAHSPEGGQGGRRRRRPCRRRRRRAWTRQLFPQAAAAALKGYTHCKIDLLPWQHVPCSKTATAAARRAAARSSVPGLLVTRQASGMRCLSRHAAPWAPTLAAGARPGTLPGSAPSCAQLALCRHAPPTLASRLCTCLQHADPVLVCRAALGYAHLS
jgi:hypothetical protein